jgi:D-alanyl-D-alanine endopeptidase (penicillin-binding protein 7)
MSPGRQAMGRFIRFVGMALALSLALTIPAAAHPKRRGPVLQARAAVMIDLTTGQRLLAKQANLRLPIASVTKLMTAMVVLDAKQSMIRPLRVTPDDVDRLKWSTSRLPVGSLLFRRSLLRIALMSSENRAAFALSRYYPGKRPGFVRAMNRKARRLGMRATHFVDPTGLSPHNVSTAENVSRMARAAYRYTLIRRYTTRHQHSVLGGDGILMYRNTDPLVFYRTWHVKMQKTGFINEAGHCLVVITPIRGHLILMVLLGEPNDHAPTEDAARLRSWAVALRTAPRHAAHRR